ncbi:MAG: HD domain-containing protein, partial [Endozoicomonas sp.]
YRYCRVIVGSGWQLAFVLELDKLKAVYRKTQVKPDGHWQDISAENSWHISLLPQAFAEYAEKPVDLSRVTGMLLIHDVVEIDAGDMFAFAESDALSQQREKEQQAADRLFGFLPSGQRASLKTLWQEFEQSQPVPGSPRSWIACCRYF